MKTLLMVVALLLAVGGLVIFKFVGPGISVTKSSNIASATSSPVPPNDDRLTATLRKLCDKSGGKVSVAVLHVESGKLTVVDASNELPLFSVYKLPLAIAVLKDIEEGRLHLDQKVHVGPDDVVPGWRGNTRRWLKPIDLTIKQLLELSIVESDNTSSEKLLQLTGGPAAVTGRMRSLDLQQIDIRTTRKEYVAARSNPLTPQNTGSALGLVKLLSRLQVGELLQNSATELLLGLMERAKTGLRRLRGNLPPDTKVADKSGSGDPNPQTNLASSTNDVGLITLPNARGHLAMVVLLHDSTLPDEQQEKLITDLARAAFDAYSSSSLPS
ncbi:MAG TPA: class A beta-lactamase [Pyrinomonadaceae bacterium]|nr:class A beta-lactamase [Pyrinomonadaceae bacterium]